MQAFIPVLNLRKCTWCLNDTTHEVLVEVFLSKHVIVVESLNMGQRNGLRLEF